MVDLTRRSVYILVMQSTRPSPRRGRPRKVAATDPDTRQALLTEQGFTASGIDGILKAADVPKGSFYYYFATRLARCLT